MNPRKALLLAIGLLSACALGMAGGAFAPTSAAARPPTAPAANTTTLTWTQGVVSYPYGDWDGAVQTAASWTEGGFTDWRLPTPDELQAALQDGSWGQGTPNASHNGWTSRTSGVWAYAVRVVTDGNGNPIAAQSGLLKKYRKVSNFAATKFVRP